MTTLTDKIARTVYAGLTNLPPESLDQENDEFRQKYTGLGEAVVGVVSDAGYLTEEDNINTLVREAEEVEFITVEGAVKLYDKYSKKQYGTIGEWLLEFIVPAVLPLRHTVDATEVEGLLVSPIGDAWFVTGTSDVNIATGAIVHHLTENLKVENLLTAAASLISATPVAAEAWLENPGELVRAEPGEGTFSGVYFYTAEPSTPVADELAEPVEAAEPPVDDVVVPELTDEEAAAAIEADAEVFAEALAIESDDVTSDTAAIPAIIHEEAAIESVDEPTTVEAEAENDTEASAEVEVEPGKKTKRFLSFDRVIGG